VHSRPLLLWLGAIHKRRARKIDLPLVRATHYKLFLKIRSFWFLHQKLRNCASEEPP